MERNKKLINEKKTHSNSKSINISKFLSKSPPVFMEEKKTYECKTICKTPKKRNPNIHSLINISKIDKNIEKSDNYSSFVSDQKTCLSKTPLKNQKKSISPNKRNDKKEKNIDYFMANSIQSYFNKKIVVLK